LLAERRALVLVVWKAGLGFELLEIPSVVGLPPAPIDIRTALDIDQAMYEQAQRLAEKGARIAREAGFDAVPLLVAEDAEVPISETVGCGNAGQSSRSAAATAPRVRQAALGHGSDRSGTMIAWCTRPSAPTLVSAAA
jgi:hypothetical protein